MSEEGKVHFVAAGSSDLAALRRKRAAMKGVITKMHNALKEPDAEVYDKAALRVREERLRALFSKWEELNLDIAAMDPDAPEDDNVVESTYIDALTIIARLLSVSPEDKQTLSSQDSKVTKHSKIKLPNVVIPTFNGKYRDYQAFIGLFDALIHKNNNLEDIEKLFYLQTYLQDEPRDLIKNLPLCKESYDEARKILNDRYNNKYKITNDHLNIILDISPITKSTAVNIRNFLSVVKQQLAALRNLGHCVEQWDPILICILTKKLDLICNREFELGRKQQPSVTSLIEFLEKRALALENVERDKSSPAPKVVHVATVKKAQLTSTAKSCLSCKCPHKLFACPQFKLMPVSDRIKFVTANNLCRICLNNHNKPCRYKFKCHVCKSKHNSLLHEDETPSPVTLVAGSTTEQILLPTAQVKLLASNGTEVHAKAILDSGSQVSFATKELANLLNLPIQTTNTPIIGIGQSFNKLKQSVNLELHSLTQNFKIFVTCFLLDRITSKLPQKSFDTSKLVFPPNIVLADKRFNESSNIHILLGADIMFQVLLPPEPAVIQHSDAKHADTTASPPLLNTKFGHVVAGSIHLNNVNFLRGQAVASLFCETCTSDLNQTLSEFWKCEKIPETFVETHSEHELCENIFLENIQLDSKNNKLQVVLPLKQPLECINQFLGDSFHLALKRFHNLEIRLAKDPILYKLYKDFIHDYINQGHGTVIDISQYNLTTDPVYFLPHHPVLNLQKKTTKCRVVMDGSMKTNNKTSLNNLLLNGPVVQKELVDVLLLFRVDNYFFITDIQNMFRNILLHPEYRSLQNILWRDNPNVSVQCIQLNTVTYGLKSSSYLATRCLKWLAEQYRDDFPLAAFIINNCTYVDDILFSESSVERLIEARDQLCKLLNLGGFQLHKWVSNSNKLLQDIPQHRQHFDDVDLQTNNYSLKTLGMTYNTQSDSFIMSSPKPIGNMPQTKREILSFISQFFDPLGLVGPIVVSAKVIMQRLWKAQLDWDSLPDNDLLQAWHSFYSSLIAMKTLIIERHIALHSTNFAQIIGFADASSSTAYGCCVYLRCVDNAGNVKLSLLCSKSRINPASQSLSVPRLELNAALLLARLANRVHETLSVKINIQNMLLYSDSQIVLAWLNTNISTLKAYVANRVKVILQLTKGHAWLYIGSSENPADCLSRGVTPHELADHPLWWSGPKFLHTSEYKPSLNFTKPQELPEVKDPSTCLSAMVCTTAVSKTLCLDFLDKFSDINKMQRVLAYVLRFCQNTRSKGVRNKLNYVNSQELDKSLSTIVLYEQHKFLKEDIHVLKCGKTIVKGSLKDLCPFIDDSGLLRVGGRLHNAAIPYSQKHPIILPRDSRITNLIIRSEHLRNFHAGPKLTLSSLRQRFWIVHGLREVKKVLHKCTMCFRLKAEASKQLMGSLPPDRVKACRAFQKVGLDYTGAISLKIARVRKPIITKGYVCVFVCFVTKAIHLELASDLKTETFIACLNRFIARRGMPTDIYSDNASTFKCAKKQLDDMYHLHSSKEHQRLVTQFTAQNRVNFHFLPCYSPVFAGLAESGVKSCKNLLKRELQKSCLTYEELSTVLCQIEAILNSRPLMPLTNDITDYSCITPGHFLIGTALNTYPDANLTMITRSQFWKTCNEMKLSFWKSWSKHYLNLLQSRPKWQTAQPNVKIGSLVILRDDNLAPMYWPLARVINTFPGHDGKVRVVEVKTSNGHIHRRAVMKICVLPLEGEDGNSCA